jgi:hypothetical protein
VLASIPEFPECVGDDTEDDDDDNDDDDDEDDDELADDGSDGDACFAARSLPSARASLFEELERLSADCWRVARGGQSTSICALRSGAESDAAASLLSAVVHRRFLLFANKKKVTQATQPKVAAYTFSTLSGCPLTVMLARKRRPMA